MIKFNYFDEFYDHLTHSIRSGKDVYIFSMMPDDTDADYYFDDENDDLFYYVNCFINFPMLHRNLHCKFIDEYGMDLIIVHDWFTEPRAKYEYWCEHVERLHIFKSL